MKPLFPTPTNQTLALPGSLTNKKKNKAPFYAIPFCGDPTPTPPSYQASHLLLFINLSPVSSDKFETLRGKHPHRRRMMSWCNLSKASSQKWPLPRLEIDFAASVVLIPPGEEWYRLRENRFSRRRRKNNGEKAIPIGGIQAIHFFWKK